MIEQKNIQKLLKNFSFIFLFVLSFILSTKANADLSKCKDPELQEKVKQVAKEERVDSNELLSVIAHESRCNYFVIAWNLPGAPQTAKNKFFESLEEARSFAEELISTRKYRVDVGIGQINNEANIKRKRWTLDEVLNPETALHRVAKILKERSWFWYHSNNPFYAKRWRALALNVLNQIKSDSDFVLKASSHKPLKNFHEAKRFFKKSSENKTEFALFMKREKTQNTILVYAEPNSDSSINISKFLNFQLKKSNAPKQNASSLMIYGTL